MRTRLRGEEAASQGHFHALGRERRLRRAPLCLAIATSLSCWKTPHQLRRIGPHAARNQLRESEGEASRFVAAPAKVFTRLFDTQVAQLLDTRWVVGAEVEPGHLLRVLVANLEGPRLEDDHVVILARDEVLDVERIGAIELHAA